MPLALILGTLLFGSVQAKAQTVKPVWIYYDTNLTFIWDITYHNIDTNVDYNFNTSSVTDGQSGAQLGFVPEGNYTVTLTNDGPYTDYFDLQVGSTSAITEDDSVYIQYGYSHTMSSTIVVNDVDSEADIYIYNY